MLLTHTIRSFVDSYISKEEGWLEIIASSLRDVMIQYVARVPSIKRRVIALIHHAVGIMNAGLCSRAAGASGFLQER